MLEYFYNRITKQFLYSADAAIDPEETIRAGTNVYLSAANATFKQPLQKKSGYSIIFNGTDWEYIQDHRGIRVWKEDFSSIIIDTLGPIPQGYSTKMPEIPKPPLTVKDFDIELQTYIKNVRVARGYTTRQPDAYLNSKNERWKQDALDFIDFRDACMEYALNLYNNFQESNITITLQQFKQNLPKIKWTFE